MNAQIEYLDDYAYLVIDGEQYELPVATAQSIAADGITITMVSDDKGHCPDYIHDEVLPDDNGKCSLCGKHDA